MASGTPEQRKRVFTASVNSTHVIGEPLAVERRGRTGRHVMDAKAGLDELGRRGTKVVATGVDVDLVAEARERARKLADVDVHAPAVARSRLGQGRRVIREDREARHERNPTGLVIIGS